MIEAPTTVSDSLARVVRFAQELIAQRCNSWVARRAAVPCCAVPCCAVPCCAVPCKEPTEIFHVRPLLTMERNQALMATTELGHMPMHLPEEAEEGDERTKAAIKRDQELRNKVEVSVGHAARCKREHHMLRLLAPSSAGRFHSSFTHAFFPSLICSSIHHRYEVYLGSRQEQQTCPTAASVSAIKS